MISFEDWQKYVEKSGDPNPVLYTEANFKEVDGKGWVSWDVNGDVLLVHQVYGDGDYWHKFLLREAKMHLCKSIVGFVYRSPKGYERKYGMKTVGYIIKKEVDDV